jgi:hypothetical protein
MSTEKPDPKNTTEPGVKTTKLPDLETEIPDEELEKASGGAGPLTPNLTIAACSAACMLGGDDK